MDRPHLTPDRRMRERLIAALRDLTPRGDYARGVVDTLHLLGLVRSKGDTTLPTGEIAEMVIDSLLAHLNDGVLIRFDWNDLDAEGLRGADILRAIEAARLTGSENPTVERTVKVVQAIFKARRGAPQGGIEDIYLMQYDPQARQYQPLGGRLQPSDENMEAALRREIAEELELAQLPGPEICTLVLLSENWGTIRPSPTYGTLTHYSFDFYHVVRARFEIMMDMNTRWLAREEIMAGRARDGRAVSTVYLESLGLDALDSLSTL